MSQQKGIRERLEAKLSKVLDPNEKRLLSLINIETRKDKLLFRMPKDVISLEDIWCKVKEVAKELKISVSQQEMYATVLELDEVIGEIKWLWKDWLPRGFVTMLVGDPGIGKSMLVLSIVNFILTGEDWPTCKNDDKPSNVIWIDTEASQQLLRIRSINMNIDRSKLYIPVVDGDILGQIDVMNEEHRDIILDMIENLEPSLIVLDSLGGSHTRGENKFEEISPIMKFFAVIARDKNIAVLMTHHLNKGMQGENPEISLYRIRGSTAIPQFSRSIMAMEKVNDKEVKLRMIKSNLSRKAEPLLLMPSLNADGEIMKMDYKEYKPPPGKITKQETCANWVVLYLKEHEKENPEGIRLKNLIEAAEGEGYTRGNIYAAKTFLRERIQVKGTGKEAYWFYVGNNTDTASVEMIINAKRSKKDGQ